MQVPERLALIGGSILLASTLVFTLKSQTSSVLPHVSAKTEDVMAGKDVQKERAEKQAQAAQQAKAAQQAQQAKEQQEAHEKWWNSLSGFDQGNETAKQKGWKTGMWGSSKYYIDDHGNMSVGDGKVQGHLADLLGNDSNNIKNVSFTANAQHDSDSVLNSNAINQRNQQAEQQREQQQAQAQAAANNNHNSSGGSSYDSGGSSYVPPSSSEQPSDGPGKAMGHAGDNNGGTGDNVSFPPAPTDGHNHWYGFS